MKMHAGPLPASFRRRARTAGTALVLFLLLGTTVESCEDAYLDFFCALYTGLYGEFGCIVDCSDLDFFADQDEFIRAFWSEVFCEENGIPLSRAAAKTGETQAAVPALFYSAGNDRILRMINDASVTELAIFGRYPLGIDLDAAAGKVYWTDGRTESVRRANLDGTGEEVLVTGIAGVTGLAVDPAGKVYWGNSSGSKIQRADLDGANVEDVATGLTAPFDLAFDPAGGALYWTLYGPLGGKLQRLVLADGGEPEDLVTGLTSPYGLALDAAGGRIYWTDMTDSTLQRANLDGTGVETVLSGLNTPGAVALDVAAGKAYWVDMQHVGLRRSNLDGTGTPEVLATFQSASDLALDAAGGFVYWAGWVDGSVRRRPIGSPPTQTLVLPRAISGDVALAPAIGKMYWCVVSTGTVQRANLDGTEVEDVVVGVPARNVAVDTVNQKLYWTSGSDIRRADLDGSNPETVASGIVFLGAIEVDGLGGKLYWIDRQVIRRANLDGTSVQTVTTDVSFPQDLAVHNGTGKLFWTVPFTGVIRRSNLDGSGIQDLLSGLVLPLHVAIADDGLFWTTSTAIQRAGLDGTGVATLLTGAADLTGLAVLGADRSAPLPVELTRFDAVVDGTDVLLTWQTVSETNNAGFEIQKAQRSAEGGAGAGWQRVDFVDGHGTSAAPQVYRYRIAGLGPGPHRFRLKQVDFDGAFTYSGIVEVDVSAPAGYALEGNYPNPFNPRTTIRYTLPAAGSVRLRVLDVRGREVAILVDEPQAAGRHDVPFSAGNLASGLYFYRLEAGAFAEQRAMLLVK